MVRRSVSPFCIGIVVLFFVLSMTQDCPALSDPCNPDPCQGIPNAVAGTCVPIGGGSCIPPSDFSCSCDSGYTWQDATNTCEEVPVDPCVPDPCESIQNAVPGSCVAVGGDDFTCDCDPGYDWQDASNTCEGLPGGPMAQIPAGCFDMGDSSDGCYYDDECPVHNVCISAFEMDVHEVTNAEYAECVDDLRCIPPYYTNSHTRETYYGDPADDDFPVIWVPRFFAERYCAWAGKRLPTEAEWEYAARGGLSGKRYPWGDTISCDDACYGRGASFSPCWDHCHNGACENDTHPVGNYAPNGYGLYDMVGNVCEWVNDWYQADYYTVSPPIDPPGPVSPSWRIVRNGSWQYVPFLLRVAFRDNISGGGVSPELGFRCARGCLDRDEDGYGYPGDPTCTYPDWDCDDTDSMVGTGTTEGPSGDPTCWDAIDNDCDTATDTGDVDCWP